MNIAIITGLYATESNPSGGSYIYERIKELRKIDSMYHIYIISRKYSRALLFLSKKILHTDLTNQKAIPWDNEEDSTIIYDKINVLRYLFSVLTPKYYWYLKKRDLLQKIKINQDTIIHAHWAYPHGYFAVKLASETKTKSVITCHGSDIHSTPNLLPSLKKITVSTLEQANKVIFVSRFLLTQAQNLGYSGDNATVIHNGVNLDAFYSVDKKIALEKTGWKQQKRYVVGFVGNLIYIKRADKFVEIFSEIQKIIKDVEFILVGDGELSENIRREAKEANLTVTITGRVPHESVHYWMNLFDIMVLPSRKESWGCVVQEAFACGVPVVGSDAGGIPEAINQQHLIVPDGDNFEKRFADAVSNLLIKNMKTDLLKQQENIQTWEDCVNQEINVYQSLFSDK